MTILQKANMFGWIDGVNDIGPIAPVAMTQTTAPTIIATFLSTLGTSTLTAARPSILLPA